MAPKRKKKKKTQQKTKPQNRTDVFNPAFKGLKRWHKTENPENNLPQQPKQGTRVQQKPDENDIFLKAMTDVTPLIKDANTVTRNPDPNLRPSHPLKDDELEVMAHLVDLVSGLAEMDITFSDEYIEGAVRGFDKKLMKKLKKGQFPIQDHVDLHGLTKREAKAVVQEFLQHSHQMGLRCVLVIHGRGLNSENHIPVLKERLPDWLNRGPIKKIVLAFSTARPYDGGTGAVYILLRKGRSGI